MPRATIQKLTCGAIGRLLRPITAPGLIVSNAYTPVSKSEQPRPQPRNDLSIGLSCVSPGWLYLPARVRLPDLDQHVAHRRARAVDHAAFDANVLALGLRAGQHVGEVLVEDVEAGLLRREADVDVRSRRLRRRFLHVGELVHRVMVTPAPSRRRIAPGSRTTSRASRAARCRTGSASESSCTPALRSSGAISCCTAASFGIERRIGHVAISGSPAKYICVTSRCAQPVPNSEKWMCAGARRCRGCATDTAPGLIVR